MKEEKPVKPVADSHKPLPQGHEPHEPHIPDPVEHQPADPADGIPTPVSIEDIEALLAAAPPLFPERGEPFPGDPDATWRYWTDHDTAERGVPDEWVWERLRNRRDALLAACDFRVVPDAPWDTAVWVDYRQALRDLPDNTVNPRQAVWPTEPGA